MNKDWIGEFFERDLSDEELGQLADTLSSEEEALRFSERARLFHRGLGTLAALVLLLKLAMKGLGKGVGGGASAPGLGGSGASLAGKAVVVKAAAIALGTSVAIGTSVVAYKAVHAPPAVPVPVTAKAPPVSPTAPPVRPAAPRAKPAATRRGKQLVIRLDLKEPASVEMVVKDAEGKQVSSLGTQALAAGKNRVVWNGRAADGSTLPPGRYEIVTRWNGKELSRWVELRPGKD